MIKGSDKTAGLQLPVIIQQILKKDLVVPKNYRIFTKIQNKVVDWFDQKTKLRILKKVLVD